MDIPSSPPLAVPIDPPSSPPSLSLPFPSIHSRRKRHFDDNLSSDPLFSEDVSENEDNPAPFRKRQYRGPWWGHSKQDRAPRNASVFADSGVWLASESSAALSSDMMDEDTIVEELDLDSKLVSPVSRRSAMDDVQYTPGRTSGLAELAARAVMRCIETGNESVDLSGMSLKEIDDQTIRPLHQMVLTRSFDEPDSDSFAPLTPSLRIFLSGNALSSLPPSLWILENITVLSLRNNNLSEIPPGIGKLSKLKELNIAGNTIRHLPWELLGLIRSRQGQTLRLTTHPNPLCQPVPERCLAQLPPMTFARTAQVIEASTTAALRGESDAAMDADQMTLLSMVKNVAEARQLHRAEDPSEPMTPAFGSTSRVQYHDVDGSPCRSHRTVEVTPTLQESRAEYNHTPRAPCDGRRAPSLFELSTRAFRKHYASVHPTALADIDVTEPVAGALSRVCMSKDQPLPTCSVCDAAFVLARAEWVEFWHCDMNDDMVPSHLLFLPFLRRACSWACVDRAWDERSLGH